MPVSRASGQSESPPEHLDCLWLDTSEVGSGIDARQAEGPAIGSFEHRHSHASAGVAAEWAAASSSVCSVMGSPFWELDHLACPIGHQLGHRHVDGWRSCAHTAMPSSWREMRFLERRRSD